MARVVGVSDTRVQRLESGWEYACIEPNRALDPEAMARVNVPWLPARVPGTVAGEGGQEAKPDESDFWYRTRFVAPARPYSLRFGGLATFADVFLDGRPLFSSENMFVERESWVRDSLGRPVDLAIRFRALANAIPERKPRARWRAQSITPAAIRWARTSLLSRTPGLAPPIHPVGPWRPIELVEHGAFRVISARMATRTDERGGTLLVHVVIAPMPSALPATLRAASIRIGSARARLEVSSAPNGEVWLTGVARLSNAELWWPHTHGGQALYPVALEIDLDGRPITIDLGKTGFRKIALSTDGGDFAISVNGVPVFCRGACWLPIDPIALDGSIEAIDHTLNLARDAGMNMLRVAAQGIYESDYFFDRAAELGLLIWQDFMFARLDYPVHPDFVQNVELEARKLVDRTETCPALAIICGNSEVEQQATMLGFDPMQGRSELFEAVLAKLVAKLRPDVPYLPSTPSGGALPFHADAGVSHYFGVGAYLRPLTDARLANVRFASECLAFSNVPDREMLERVTAANPAGANPGWKAAVSRDGNATWDFEDVRDHYLEELFRLDARELRRSDPERWLELGRLATGEVMARTFAEFRRAGSKCRGALVWHLRDLVPGAGSGLIDASGKPKAAYWFLSRACQPVALFLVDEGLNGLRAHAINDTENLLNAELVVAFLRNGQLRVDHAQASITVPPRSAVELSVDTLLGRFTDPTYAYRFGPPSHDVTTAVLCNRGSSAIYAEAVHFPLGPPATRRSDLELAGTLRPHPLGFALTLSATAFAYGVHVECTGFEPSDDYFHIEPTREKRILLRPLEPSLRSATARITASNAASTLTLRAEQEERQSA